MLSLSETFQEDAAEVKSVLMLFGGQDAKIIKAGRRKTGAELAVHGAEQAADHAEQVAPGWGDAAFRAVKEFSAHVKACGDLARTFKAEDVRSWARHVPPAPSLRAWGAVMLKAARAGIIRQTGYAKVNNPLAHSTPAALWEAI